MIFFSNKSRPYHLGPYPLERIARDPALVQHENEQEKAERKAKRELPVTTFAAAVDKYHDVFHSLRADDPAPARAPVPDDLGRRAIDIKGAAYFLNASQVGICELAENGWLEDAEPLAHTHAISILVELGRTPEDGDAGKRLGRGLRYCNGSVPRVRDRNQRREPGTENGLLGGRPRCTERRR